MMSGDGGRVEGEVVSFTVIFSRIKNTFKEAGWTRRTEGGPKGLKKNNKMQNL